jgi:hypothetical protein
MPEKRDALERGDVASAEDLADRFQPGPGASFAERYPHLAAETLRQRAFREVMEAPDDEAAEARIATWSAEGVLTEEDGRLLREERAA